MTDGQTEEQGGDFSVAGGRFWVADLVFQVPLCWLDFPASLQNQCSLLIALSGARNRTKGHFLACPKPWVMGHCPCKRGTSYRTPCKRRGKCCWRQQGRQLPLAEVTTYLMGRGDFAIPAVFLGAWEPQCSPGAEAELYCRLSVFQALGRKQQHVASTAHLSRSCWECLGWFVYGYFVLSELLREAGGLCWIMDSFKSFMISSLTICQLEVKQGEKKRKSKFVECPDLCKRWGQHL